MLNNLAKQAFTHALSNRLIDRAFDDAMKAKIYVQLMHATSELGEAYNAIRKDDWDNFKEEVADSIIAVLTLCGMCGLDMDQMIEKKMEYNKKRTDHLCER